MLAILAITAPLFLLIGVGYAVRLMGIMSPEQMQGVGIFVMYCALPSLVIRALTQQPLEDVLQLNYLLAYGLGSLGVLLTGLLISVKLQRQPLNLGAMQALGMAAANSGFVGYPVAAMIIGPPAAIMLALNMVIETLIVIPTALILAETSLHRGQRLWVTMRKTALSLIKNPVLLGVLVGVAFAVSGLPLPATLAKAIDMLAEAAGPAALFVIGGSLYGLHVKGMARDVSQIVAGKLLLHPLAILVAFWLTPGIAPIYLAGALIFAAAPMVSTYSLFGQRYGLGGVSAAAMLVATTLSFISLNLVIWLMTLVGLLDML